MCFYVCRKFKQACFESSKKHKSLNIAVEAFFVIVGKTGFEPATPWSQTKCATGLRYFPFHYNLRYKYFKPVIISK
jgi:hypothetical protein